MRNGFFRENLATYCQEIEEFVAKKRIWASQLRIDEVSTAVSQLLTQILDLHNKVTSLTDARDFNDPETASSSGATHVPSQPSPVPSPRSMPCRDSGLPHDTRHIVCTSGNVFERQPAPEGLPSALFEDSKNPASSSHELKYNGTRKGNETRTAEFVNTCTTFPKWRWHIESLRWNPFSRWYA